MKKNTNSEDEWASEKLDNSDKERFIGRRNYLKATGAVLSVVPFIGRISAGNDTEKVPWVLGKNGVKEYREVPIEWYNQRNLARKVNEQITQNHLDEKGVVSVGQVAGSTSFEGDAPFYELNIRVEVNPDDFEGGIPDQVRGVPIQVMEAEEQGLASCTNDGDFSVMPGGVTIEPASGGFGTSCCRVKWDGQYWMLTAAHLWGACGGDINGDSADQNGDYIGDVKRHDADSDFALVSDYTLDTRFDNTIHDGSSRTEVTGVLSKPAIDAFVGGSSDGIRKVGVTTGFNKGNLTASGTSSGFDCVDFEGEGIQWDIDTAEGDSGGPLYTNPSNDGLNMAGITQMYVNQYDTASCGSNNALASSGRGVAAYHLRNNKNLTFDT